MIIKNLPDGTPYCEIPLTQGQITWVSPSDYPELSKHNWYASIRKRRFKTEWIPQRNERHMDGKRRQIKIAMTAAIVKPRPGMFVDHRDGNTLNNTRENLRECTPSQNACNKKVLRNKRLSKFKGVTHNRFTSRTKKWSSRMMLNGVSHHLGYFSTEHEAALAYDNAVLAFQGAFGQLNFPDRLTDTDKSDLVCTSNENS